MNNNTKTTSVNISGQTASNSNLLNIQPSEYNNRLGQATVRVSATSTSGFWVSRPETLFLFDQQLPANTNFDIFEVQEGGNTRNIHLRPLSAAVTLNLARNSFGASHLLSITEISNVLLFNFSYPRGNITTTKVVYSHLIPHSPATLNVKVTGDDDRERAFNFVEVNFFNNVLTVSRVKKFSTGGKTVQDETDSDIHPLTLTIYNFATNS